MAMAAGISRVVVELEQFTFVIHTIAPEKYRFWKSNQPGMCPRPITVSRGPHGTVLVLDYDLDKAPSKLTTVHLHQPADVCMYFKRRKA